MKTKLITKTDKKINKYHILILFFSLLSIIPMSFLLYGLYQLKVMADIGRNTEKFVLEVFSRNITTPFILYPFIIGLISWVGGSIFSIISILKNKVSKIYGFTTLVFGGIGLHLLLMPFISIKFNIKNTIKKILLFIPFVIFALGMSLGIFMLGFQKSIDDPVIGNPIKYAVYNENKKSPNPNVIEIFTDGFSQWNKEDYKNEPSFKDFTWYSKFQTPSILTHRSIPSMWAGFNKYNPFQLRKDRHLTKDTFRKEVYNHIFLEAGINHLKLFKNNFDQINLINTINFAQNKKYNFTQSVSGDPKIIKKIYPELNVTNWSGAKEYNLKHSMSFSNLSPDANSYLYASKNINVNKWNKGARILIHGQMTHRPFIINEKGHFSIFSTKPSSVKAALKKNLKLFIDSLKNMKKGTKNVYDNSLIIIYGDHESHDKTIDIKNFVQKAESAMMIKYPKWAYSNKTYPSGNSMKIINDKVIFAGYLNNIIEDFLNNHNANYITKKKKLFDPKIKRAVFLNDNKYVMTQWGQNHIKKIPGTKIMTYSKWEHNPKNNDLSGPKYGWTNKGVSW